MTNRAIGFRSGTEVVIRDLALGLVRRGHQVDVFAPTIAGEISALTSEGVAVVDDLRRLTEAPDIIHGQHNIPSVEAMIRFPRARAVWVCHDFLAWHDEPPRLPQIHRYAAVDETCRERLLNAGVPTEDTVVIHNAVDLTRVPPRPEPLPKKLRRALAFTKTAGELAIIQAVCDRIGLPLDTAGAGADRIIADPERQMVNYDLVFATARGAIEAMACGCAVIVVDARGFAGLVTTRTYDRWRRLNFGLRALSQPVSEDAVARALAAYDRDDAAKVVAKHLRIVGVEQALDAWENLYATVLAEPLRVDDRAWRDGMLDLLAGLDKVCAAAGPPSWRTERPGRADIFAPSLDERTDVEARFVPFTDNIVPCWDGPRLIEGDGEQRLRAASQADPWSFLVRVRLKAELFDGPQHIVVEMDNLKQPIVVGMVNQDGDGFICKADVRPGAGAKEIWLPLDDPHPAFDFVIQNGLEPAQGALEVKGLWIVRPSDRDAPPEARRRQARETVVEIQRLARAAAEERRRVADYLASSRDPVLLNDGPTRRLDDRVDVRRREALDMSRVEVMGRTSAAAGPYGPELRVWPEPAAWAHGVSLRLDDLLFEGGQWVVVQTGPVGPSIGLALLTPGGDSYAARVMTPQDRDTLEIWLPVLDPQAVRALVVQNWLNPMTQPVAIRRVTIVSETAAGSPSA